MEKKSIVIIQDNEKRNMELQKIIAATSDLEVVGIATDGIGGYKLIEEKKPDFVVSELLLAGFDGFCILDKLRSSGLETKVILVSAFVREDIVAKALSKGAAFFIAKPYAYEVLIERIRDLDETRAAQKARVYGEGVRRNTLDEKISNIFINVGIPPHIKGYAYQRVGVDLYPFGCRLRGLFFLRRGVLAAEKVQKRAESALRKRGADIAEKIVSRAALFGLRRFRLRGRFVSAFLRFGGGFGRAARAAAQHR